MIVNKEKSTKIIFEEKPQANRHCFSTEIPDSLWELFDTEKISSEEFIRRAKTFSVGCICGECEK